MNKIMGKGLCSAALLGLFLTGCQFLPFLPGSDRLISPESLAEVGPLVDLHNNPIGVAAPEAVADAALAPVDEGRDKNSNKANQSLITSSEAPLSSIAPAAEVVATPPEKVKAKAVMPRVTPETTPSSAMATPSSVVVAASSNKKIVLKKITTGNLSGWANLVDDKGNVFDPTGSMVILHPQFDYQTKKSTPKTHFIDMEKKVYLPREMIIGRDDRVFFVNKDKIRHNVFSSSARNAFDLGTYGAGLKRAVTLKESGIVKVYCNIHADMATFIAVGEPELTAAVDKQGRFSLQNIPAGEYSLQVWNVRGEAQIRVHVAASKTTHVDASLTIERKVASHKNKFGDQYSKRRAGFDDEFY